MRVRRRGLTRRRRRRERRVTSRWWAEGHTYGGVRG
jgi:hypothetical protein